LLERDLFIAICVVFLSCEERILTQKRFETKNKVRQSFRMLYCYVISVCIIV